LPEGAVWRGNPRLVPLLVPVASLHEDPANVNTHPERSVAAIAASYARFGQQKPLVCGPDMTVRDGNGQLHAAAERLGWTHVAAIPSDLDGVELSAYALAANRTAQHAEWDFEALSDVLRAMRDGGHAIDDLGWADYELEPLLAATWTPPEPGPLPGGPEARDAGEPVAGGKVRFVLEVPADDADVLRRAVAAARGDAADDSVASGLVEICRAYLAARGEG
jgi:hypothetical protein